MKKTIKASQGITLVSLIVTIIVLLILAGITITLTIGREGLISRIQMAQKEHEQAQEEEEEGLRNLENEMNNYANLDGNNNSNNNNNNTEFGAGTRWEFTKGSYGFEQTLGEVEFSSLGVKPTRYDNTGEAWALAAKAEKVLDNPIILGPKFEISSQIFFDNRTTNNMGGIYINLYKKENDEHIQVVRIHLRDAWAGFNKIGLNTYINEISLGQTATLSSGSGRYGIVGDGQKVYFYWENYVLGSADYTGEMQIDKIEIEIEGYSSSYPVPNIIVEDLYIGEPQYYRTFITE